MFKTSRPNTFDDAYRILDEALLAEPTPLLGPLIENEVQQFKSQFKTLMADESRQAGVVVNDLASLGIEHASQIAKSIDKDIRENPALYLGVVALGALAVGVLFMGSNSQSVRAAPQPRRVHGRKPNQIHEAQK